MKCRDCGESMRPKETVCACGWSVPSGKATSTTGRMHECNYCAGTFFYPTKSSGKPRTNYIVGRDRTGKGHICRDCYEGGAEPDYRDTPIGSANKEATL